MNIMHWNDIKKRELAILRKYLSDRLNECLNFRCLLPVQKLYWMVQTCPAVW